MPPRRRSEARRSLPARISTPAKAPDDGTAAAAPRSLRSAPPPPPPPAPASARRVSKRQAKIEPEPQQEPAQSSARKKAGVKAEAKGNGKGNGKGKGKGTQAKVEVDNEDTLAFPGGKGFAVVIETGPARRMALEEYLAGEVSADDEGAPRPKRVRESKGKGNDRAIVRIDSDEEDDAVAASASKRRGGGKGKEKEEEAMIGLSDEEKEDLKEDLAYIAPKRQVLSTRTRNAGGAPKLTPFQKKLKELKAKRAGLPINPDSDSDSDSPRAALYDTDPSDASGEEASTDDRYPRADDNLDNESWIIDDEEDAGTLGHPDNQVPLQYTHLSHQSPRENFKVVCLWMVQYILNPSFPIDDPISQFALTALDRRFESWGGSVLQSSIWQPEFLRAMRARPDFFSEPCEERPICDACHISGRSATYVVWFGGSRYDSDTLLDLTESEADDGEDSAGFEIPDEDAKYYLGRFCYERAKMSHEFMHWKKSLRVAMEAALTALGYLDPKWQNKAAKMSVEERTRWANQVADNLEPQIRAFWYELRAGLRKAEDNMAFQRTGRRPK